jgi:L-lactate dehydrogenase (cytochrome)/(S)-mandelate dehydrogenase
MPDITIGDLRRRAKRRLPKILFDWIDGGAGDEHGLRENEAAFDRYRFLPRYLLDVSGRSQKKTLLGKVYDSPFGIAPTGYAGLFRPRADLISADAAKRANIPYIMSGTSIDSIERAMEVAPDHCWYQLYGATDIAITRDLIARASNAGCRTLVITIDIPVAGKRERDIRNGFAIPLRFTPRLVLDGLLHPAWTFAYLRSGGMPTMANWAPYAPAGANAMAVAEFANHHSYCVQTWDHLKQFRDLWTGKLVVKGVMHPDDATMAIDLGADGLVVSNHGGRQLDGVLSSARALPPIADAVGDRMTVLADGGIRSGLDVVRMLALGAKGVLLGRAWAWALGAGGEAGVTKMLKLIEAEMRVAMALTGTTKIAEIDRTILAGGT